jgi:hypothetical protein
VGGVKLTKWEYKIIDSWEAPVDRSSDKFRNLPNNNELTEYLNKIGNEEWELVSVIPYETEGGVRNFKAFFKKEL